MKMKRLAKKYLAGNYPVFLEEIPLGDIQGTVRTDIYGFLVNGRCYNVIPGSKLYCAIWDEAVKKGWNGCHWDSPFTFGSCDSQRDFEENEAWNPMPSVVGTPRWH